MHDVLAQHDLSNLVMVAFIFDLLKAVWPYVAMLGGFSLIVFVHELGHFAAAKWAGVRVERFAVGFGRELFGFTRGETRYSFNILPLGGYVKMLGQEDFDDKAKELQFNSDPRSFVNKPVGHRMIIVSAGVVMNVLFAAFLFMIVFNIGMETIGTSIGYVQTDSPAERAGLLPGDTIKEINGESIVEFNEVNMAVILAPTHEPIEFVVERDGELKTFSITPEYLIPENSREAKRLVVGISSGVTREIVIVGPEFDKERDDHPHVGDFLVEIDGVEITDANASRAIEILGSGASEVYVERKDPKNPDAEGNRVRVEIPPMLTLYPADRDTPANLLGLTPLVRFSRVGSRGRAALAGIEVGDTILSWDDHRYPTSRRIAQSIRECAERDIHFIVQKRNGTIASAFIRPERNERGNATIQALCRSIKTKDRGEQGAKARFTDIRPGGIAAKAGIENGDLVVACNDRDLPARSFVTKAIRTSTDRNVLLTVRKANGDVKKILVVPTAPGTIGASYELIADQLLRIGDVVATINGKPSPAAEAGLTHGSLINAVNGQRVTGWRELIVAFRENAGTTVELSYKDISGNSHTASFPVPRSLRTVLGVGPEGRIVAIDGSKTVMVEGSRGLEKVAVGYRKGLGTALRAVIGRKNVPITFRANPLAPLETKQIEVTEEMIDPWLGRIAYASNIVVAPQTAMLKGDTLYESLLLGAHKTKYFLLQVYTTMERMIFTRSVGVENLSGPLGIIDLGTKIAKTGYVKFIFFLAIISANLAVINFLPLPIVDGGLMVFLIIEKIKGRPVSLRIQIATQMVGLFLIIGAFLYVTFNDVVRIWG